MAAKTGIKALKLASSAIYYIKGISLAFQVCKKHEWKLNNILCFLKKLFTNCPKATAFQRDSWRDDFWTWELMQIHVLWPSLLKFLSNFCTQHSRGWRRKANNKFFFICCCYKSRSPQKTAIWCWTNEKRDSNSFYITLSQASSFFSLLPKNIHKRIFRAQLGAAAEEKVAAAKQ